MRIPMTDAMISTMLPMITKAKKPNTIDAAIVKTPTTMTKKFVIGFPDGNPRLSEKYFNLFSLFISRQTEDKDPTSALSSCTLTCTLNFNIGSYHTILKGSDHQTHRKFALNYSKRRKLWLKPRDTASTMRSARLDSERWQSG